MMTVIYHHPNTVSGVDTWESRIATSSYDGCVRMFDDQGALLMTPDHRASQLQCVAMRNNMIASDIDVTSGLKEGVAIDENMQIIGQPHFPTTSRILSVSRSGRYGVTIDQLCYDRSTNKSWRVVPVEAGHDKWPMGVAEASDGEVFTVDQSGHLRGWRDGVATIEFRLPAPALAFDLSADQALFVVSDENRGLQIYNRSGELLASYQEVYLVHSVKFLPDRRVVYGTHDGRLCVWEWDRVSIPPEPPLTPAPIPDTKPGKGKKK